MPAYNQSPQNAESEGFFKKLVNKCKGKKGQKDPTVRPPQSQPPRPAPAAAGPAAVQPQVYPAAAQLQAQPPQQQPQPTSPQQPPQPLQPPQVTPPEEQSPQPSNAFQYPRCRLEGEFPKFHSPLREPTDSPRDGDHRPAVPFGEDDVESFRGPRPPRRERDCGEGSLEERYRRFLQRTGRIDEYNYPAGEYPDYFDEDPYYESHGPRHSRYNSHTDMEYCGEYGGFPQPPRPPPKFSMTDPSAREAPSGPYVPSDFGYAPKMEPAFAPPPVPVDIELMGWAGRPIPPEMNYLASHTDYTYVVPLPPGVYPNAAVPQPPMFWPPTTEVAPPYNAQLLQPTANTKVTEWACDTSFNMPYNSTQAIIAHPVAPMQANFYGPASQRRLSMPLAT